MAMVSDPSALIHCESPALPPRVPQTLHLGSAILSSVGSTVIFRLKFFDDGHVAVAKDKRSNLFP